MQLIYTDESGINYDLNNKFFKDGPFILFGGICVDDRKYFHLERLFLDIILEYFSIQDWQKDEIHATNIWNLEGIFSKWKKDDVINFFEEVLQLITKLNIKTIIGISHKTINATGDIKTKEFTYAIYSFFHLVEKHLSECNDTGIIIADSNNFKTDIGDNLFTKMFYDRTQWRTNPNSLKLEIIKSKFKYESRSCFILDNIHYVDSKLSLFNQISDIIIYINMRVFTYEYLKHKKILNPDKTKVPISVTTYKYFCSKLLNIANYFKEINDVTFFDLNNYFINLTNNTDYFENNFILHMIK